MKPIIGVLPLWDDEKSSIWMLPGYMNVIRESGGIPIILPLVASAEDTRQVCSHCDGFLFSGGHDVDPALYSTVISERCGLPCEERDRLESRVFHYAMEHDLPILGICRGIQIINVLCGGTLYQDLPSEHHPSNCVNHQMTPPYDVPWHDVTLVAESPLSKLISSPKIGVNSYHHQAIKELSPQLEAMAFADDGVIEAVYMPNKRYVYAVQWHPEFNFHNDTNSRLIVCDFIAHCIS